MNVAVFNAKLERACEEAIQGGEHGVSVRGSEPKVDPEVPYGMIQYYPTGPFGALLR